jgi:hypothetical protein
MNDWKRRDAKQKRYGRDFGTKSTLPLLPYPQGAAFGVKQIAYLHAYCGEGPKDIVARYPKAVTLADVHLALAHYFRDPTAIDAEIAAELRFNTSRGLDGGSFTLPRAERD